MAEVTGITATVETRADFGTKPEDVVSFWLAQIELAEKEDKDFTARGRKIVKRYRDEREANEAMRDGKRLNVLWSNVQTLKPALYSRTPKPDVDRRFKDADPNGRLASTVLERALSFSLENSDFDHVMTQCVEDKLLPGRAIAWIRYVPHFGEPTQDREYIEAGEDTTSVSDAPASEEETPDEIHTDETGRKYRLGEEYKPVVWEEVAVDYKYWEDIKFLPARTWAECNGIMARSFLTRDELVARFGAGIGNQVSLDFTPTGLDEKAGDQPLDAFKKAIVWECWDKVKREVVWVSGGYPNGPLDKKDDPLELNDFFPCPRPLVSTTTNDKLTPVADYYEYQDQAQQIDVLTTRIDRLTRALKVAGVYAASERSIIQELVSSDAENKLIPVEDWAVFAQQKGGLEGTILWLPIKDIAATLNLLVEQRDKQMSLLYQITGISDLMRGATSPEETYGGQRLKSQYGTLRLSEHQKEVARFARDIIRIMGEVIAVHFSPETLSMMTGLPEPLPEIAPPPQQAMQNPQMAQQAQMQLQQQIQAQAQAAAAKKAAFDKAVEILREQNPCPYRIDIEADSTIAPDEDAEKEARTEFLRQLVPLLQQAIPMVQEIPSAAPLVKEIVTFAIRGFRTGRSLEEAFTEFFDKMAQQPPKPPEGKGADAAAMAKVQVDAQLGQGELALKAQQQSQQGQIEQGNLAIKAQTARGRLQIAGAKVQQDAAYDQAVVADMAAKTAMSGRMGNG